MCYLSKHQLIVDNNPLTINTKWSVISEYFCPGGIIEDTVDRSEILFLQTSGTFYQTSIKLDKTDHIDWDWDWDWDWDVLVNKTF